MENNKLNILLIKIKILITLRLFLRCYNKKQLKSLRLENVRVYIQGSNLAVWDNVKYWDPELGNANSGAKYPLSRTWTAGVEVTF